MCVGKKNFKHVHTIKANMIDCWLLKTNYRSGAKCAYTDNIYKSFLFIHSLPPSSYRPQAADDVDALL